MTNAPFDSITTLPPWKVLVVDDEPILQDVIQTNIRDLHFAGRDVQLLQANNCEQAQGVLGQHTDIAVALIDIVMETQNAGLQLVDYIRNQLHNYQIRLLICTSYPRNAPERYVIDNYDIDGYKDKADITTHRLYSMVRAAIKSYHELTLLAAHQQGLAWLLESTSNLYQIQTLPDFFQQALLHLITLCNTSYYNFPSDKVAPIQHAVGISFVNQQLSLQASLGHFTDPMRQTEIQVLLHKVEHTLRRHNNTTIQLAQHLYLFPLPNRDQPPLGFLCVETTEPLRVEQNLFQLFLNKCAAALENLNLRLELRESKRQAMYMLAVAAEQKDKTTGGHINRVVQLTTALAKAYGLADSKAEQIGLASMMHDIGKIGIPDAILQKPSKLSVEEFAIIKTHAVLGADILMQSQWFELEATIARCHHERWDGRGYPDGLAGEAIPLPARIVAVADVFDALTHKRPYNELWSISQAVEEVQKAAGSQFDPQVVLAFNELYKQEKLASMVEVNIEEMWI